METKEKQIEIAQAGRPGQTATGQEWEPFQLQLPQVLST
jgi:hypothetical protein